MEHNVHVYYENALGQRDIDYYVLFESAEAKDFAEPEIDRTMESWLQDEEPEYGYVEIVDRLLDNMGIKHDIYTYYRG